MNTYSYKAMSANGARISGIVQATDEFSAVSQIKMNCPIVLDIKEVKEKSGFLTMEIGSKKIDQKALAVMCSQFSIILKSGVSISTCMELIAGQTQDKKLRKMLAKSAEDVAQGNSIASSFEKNCEGLPQTFIETIRAGEQSGTIERSFETMQKYYDKSYKTKQKVKQAMTYPIFVLLVAIVVLIVVMVKVIPSMTSTFSELGGKLPLVTRMMIGTSNFFRHNIWWLLLVVLGITIGLKLYFNTEKGRIIWNGFKLRIPVLGKIGVLTGASQYANTMSALLTAGLTVSHALDVTGKVMDNYVLGLETSRMTGSIEEGRRLGDCMRECRYFPETLTEMCAIGENTGELESTLGTIGDYFDNEARNATEKAISKLEPTILVLMAIFAGFIVISIYLPMFTMYELM